MLSKKNAFSLIEIIIATGIITVSIFGIYKLISENTKIINNSGIITETNSLLPLLTQCIDNLGFTSYTENIGYIYNFDLGVSNEGCDLSTDIVNINNLEYIMGAKIIEKDNNYILWELIIKSEQIKTITGSYYQTKK